MPLWRNRKQLAKRAILQTLKQAGALLFLCATAYYVYRAWQYWGGMSPGAQAKGLR